MKDLIIWIILWFLVWGIFNVKIRWSIEKYKSKKFVWWGLYFAISFIITYFWFNILAKTYINQLIMGFIITNSLGMLLSFDRKYYESFRKDRFFILFMSFNILYQQTAILIVMLLLKNLIGNAYSNLIFGLFFIGIHFPLAFLPWSKLKYWILGGCFFGGWLFSYLNLNFYYGVVFSFLIHYLFYAWQIHYLKDEEKI